MKKCLVAAAMLLAPLTAPAFGAPSAVGHFTHVYNNAHLAQHPDQTVTAVDLTIKRASSDSSYKYEFLLRVKVRGKDDILRSMGSCENEGPGMRCFVECDGGGIYVNPHNDYVMMYINDRIRMSESCDGDSANAEFDLSAGKDDRDFRLFPTIVAR
jgi:hypothetical protein